MSFMLGQWVTILGTPWRKIIRCLGISDWDLCRNSWDFIRVGDLKSSEVSEVIDQSMTVIDWNKRWWMIIWKPGITSLWESAFRDPRGVIDWDLWTSVIAGLCELICDGTEGLFLRVLWESLILYMGCELWSPMGGQVWPPGGIKQISGWFFYQDCVTCVGDYWRSLWKPVDSTIWDTVFVKQCTFPI